MIPGTLDSKVEYIKLFSKLFVAPASIMLQTNQFRIINNAFIELLQIMTNSRVEYFSPLFIMEIASKAKCREQFLVGCWWHLVLHKAEINFSLMNQQNIRECFEYIAKAKKLEFSLNNNNNCFFEELAIAQYGDCKLQKTKAQREDLIRFSRAFYYMDENELAVEKEYKELFKFIKDLYDSWESLHLIQDLEPSANSNLEIMSAK